MLESMDLPLGVVLGTFGVERHRITWRGQAAHAGSTPMDKRRDALAGAAKLELELREIASRVGGGAVCTMGGVVTKPGIVTSVVETAECLLDQRHLDAPQLAEMLSNAEAASRRFAQEENIDVEWERIWNIEPILFDDELIELADESIREVAGTSHRLPSGPLHDAAEVSRAGDPDGDGLRPEPARPLAHEARGHEGGAPRAVGPGTRPPDDEGDRTPVAMLELPSGTVTFLFSDIEGSTQLLHELGADYAEALAEHRDVMRAAFAEHAGVEVDTQGDAFFAAFARASDAVAAAADIQSRLAPGPIRVRIGVHTGEPQITDEGYVGLDVHRGARVCAAGHGGQVLLSQTTRDLVDAEATDLGEHRLKDLLQPQRLFQLGSEQFPPLKTLDWTNLPVQTTPLIGRERELAEAGALLREQRLLTVVGAPGAGKTRLALQLAAEAAEEFENVWWVGLQQIRDAELVEPTIAEAVGAKGDLPGYLRDRRALLLLDNVEQLLGYAPRLAELLADTNSLKVLTTSREPCA